MNGEKKKLDEMEEAWNSHYDSWNGGLLLMGWFHISIDLEQEWTLKLIIKTPHFIDEETEG